MSYQMGSNLEARQDFGRVTLFEVTQPSKLPLACTWLMPDQYAVYEGKFVYGAQPSPADWAWRVEYVNGVTLETHPAGQPAGLGYTLFLGPESIAFGRYAGLPMPPMGFPNPQLRQRPMWLSVATIFPSLFNQPSSGKSRVITPLGTLDCVDIPTPPLAGVSGVGQYEQRNRMLVAMRFMAGTQQLCEFSLVDTNVHL